MIDREIKQQLTEELANQSFNACLCMKIEQDTAWPVYVNRAFEKMFCITQEALSARSMQDTMLSGYGESGLEGFENLLERIQSNSESHVEAYFDAKKNLHLRVIGFSPMEGYVCLILLDVTGFENSREKVESLYEREAAIADECRFQKDLLSATKNSLEETKRVYKLISENAEDGFVYYSYESGMVFTSKKWCSLFSVSEDCFRERNVVLDSIEEEYREEYREKWRRAQRERKETESFMYRLADSNTWISQTSHFWYTENGVKEVVSFYQDSTFEMLQRRELEKLAYYDSFTGVYNRNYFTEWLNEMLCDRPENIHMVQMLYIDIDRFKWVNDRLGVQMADELLLKFAAMLQGFESDNIRVARLSNDEFAIGVKQLHAGDSAARIGEELREKLKTPFLLSNGVKYYLTVSLGVAEAEDGIGSAAELIRAADLAMLESKKSGRNTMTFYKKYMVKGFVDTAVLEQKLQSVAEQEGFYLLYQPQYQVETKTLRGVEVLIRWHDEELGDISPAEFIPVSEQNGTIHRIGDFVIREALKTLHRWKREFNYKGMMSINISAVQFKDGKFLDTLQYYTGLYGLNTDQIEIELTETVFVENMEETVELIKKIKDFGYKVSLDDFGTGYSSLSYLRTVPFDTLKIDRSFITELSKEKNTTIITNSIIEMAEKLGLEVIAEGVEEQQQFDSLKQNRCGIIQGYLLGRPLAQEKVEELMV